MNKVSKEDLNNIRNLMSKYELALPVASIEEDANGVVILKSASEHSIMMMMNRLD